MPPEGPGTPRLLRAINDGAALGLLIEHGRLSRTQLGSLTGLSKPTASQMLGRLEAAGLVISVGTAVGGPGRAAELYEINPAAGHVAGLDVTPGSIRGAVVDFGGRTVAEVVCRRPRSSRGAVEHVQQTVSALVESANLTPENLSQVVIGVPGAYNRRTGDLRYASHLRGWHQPGLRSALADALRTDVDIENDVNLVALAEHHTGAAAGSQSSALLWSGDGVGAATIIDGKLNRGFTGSAGEIGFLPVANQPLVHDVAKNTTGGFHHSCSGSAILELGRSLGLRSATPAGMITAARTGTAGSEEFLDRLAERFAAGAASIVSIMDPEILVLGGPVFDAGGENLRHRVERCVADLAMRPAVVRLGLITTNPVLAGAGQVALTRLRHAILASPFGTATPTGRPSIAPEVMPLRPRPA